MIKKVAVILLAALIIGLTATTVTYANATTGAQTVAGTISQGALMTTPEQQAIESDGTNIYWTDGSGVRRQLNN